MANENDVWQLTDVFGDTLEIGRDVENGVYVAMANREIGIAVLLGRNKVRELRDFLTAKLEGNDDTALP